MNILSLGPSWVCRLIWEKVHWHKVSRWINEFSTHSKQDTFKSMSFLRINYWITEFPKLQTDISTLDWHLLNHNGIRAANEASKWCWQPSCNGQQRSQQFPNIGDQLQSISSKVKSSTNMLNQQQIHNSLTFLVFILIRLLFFHFPPFAQQPKRKLKRKEKKNYMDSSSCFNSSFFFNSFSYSLNLSFIFSL